MKKVLFTLALIAGIFATANAQFTTPRVGTGTKFDQRKLLTYSYVTATDAASATLDSLTVSPNAYHTVYRISLVDSMTTTVPVITKCYAGDNITFIISAASGTPIFKFTGTNWVSAGTVTMTTRLRSVVKFIFDGAKWVETGRYTQ